MRKHIFGFFALLLLCSTTKKDSFAAFSIVGKWQNTMKNETDSGFIFDADGSAFMYKKAEVIGGKDFELQGVKGSMKYVFDKTSTPMKLDLRVTVIKVKKENKNMLMLLQIIDNNTIKVASEGLENVRPSRFTIENSMIFKRIK